MADPKVLFEKYVNNQCSSEEIESLMKFFYSDKQDELTSLITVELEKEEPEFDNVSYNDILDSCYLNIHEDIQQEKVITRKIWPQIAAAASILIGLTLGLYFISHKKPFKQLAGNQVREILPGVNKLLLTLGNGKTIDLSTAKMGQVALQGQAAITKVYAGQINYSLKDKKDKTIQYNTITAPRGGQGSVILADGTQVWLNASSSIKFPTTFKGSRRVVVLTGEAIFKVVANANMPFRVMVKKQITEDIGTEFDINAYDDEPGIKTTLLEGSVRILSGVHTALLHPGEESNLKDGMLSVRDGDIQSAFAWKNGYLWFNNESIESIMRQLSRWYNIEVSYAGPVSKEGYYGKISRFNKIQDVLNMLEMSKGVRFRIEGSRVIVLK